MGKIMKSTQQQLESRGFVSKKTIESSKGLNDNELKFLLGSQKAAERTLTIQLLRKDKKSETLHIFCNLLKTENKLYTKLALCEAIQDYGIEAVPVLINLLGTIGNNQHQKIDLVDLNKKSFPLPRDIVGRILIRIGPDSLPFLEEVLRSGLKNRILEAIDIIGHIQFNHQTSFKPDILMELLTRFETDELMVWKIIRCLQSFTEDSVIEVLNQIIKTSSQIVFVKEAERSLNRILKKTTSYNKRII